MAIAFELGESAVRTKNRSRLFGLSTLPRGPYIKQGYTDGTLRFVENTDDPRKSELIANGFSLVFSTPLLTKKGDPELETNTILYLNPTTHRVLDFKHSIRAATVRHELVVRMI